MLLPFLFGSKPLSTPGAVSSSLYRLNQPMPMHGTDPWPTAKNCPGQSARLANVFWTVVTCVSNSSGESKHVHSKRFRVGLVGGLINHIFEELKTNSRAIASWRRTRSCLLGSRRQRVIREQITRTNKGERVA